MEKRMVISATALRSGGTFSILQDCLKELTKSIYKDWKIFALVADPEKLRPLNNNVEFVKIDSGGNYLKRIYLEYFYFRKLSREIQPNVWFSLHDFSPSVEAEVRVVYCHNPAYFYKAGLRDFFYDPTFGLFSLFYHHFYGINIEKNTFVVVQQNWLREEFARLFKLDPRKIIVAHPNISISPVAVEREPAHSATKLFIYPTMPRVFKNIELIGKACEILKKKGTLNFQVLVTIDGSESKYAKKLVSLYSGDPCLKFIGKQKRERVFELYQTCDFLVFPSRLETWGLPVSEFKETRKGILIADLPYAHETVGTYDKVMFFDPNDASSLAARMQDAMEGKAFEPHSATLIQDPFARNWTELFQIIMSGDSKKRYRNEI